VTVPDLEMEMHDSLDNLTVAVMRLRAENDRMRAELLAAAEQFTRYADYHLAKKPRDHEKAAANDVWATRCREAAKF
jgi:hypothetical protein